MNFEIAVNNNTPVMNDFPFEIVERKGRGHPDTMCDLIAEEVSRELEKFYLQACGRVLHYNVDKAFLVGGVSQPCFGVGKIIEPAKFYLGDRAIARLGDRTFDLETVVGQAVSFWLEKNVRFMQSGKNLIWKNEIHQGAASLNDVEDRDVSNDTSVGVGYWPLSNVEEIVLAVEEYMNSPVFKFSHPESGEDIKVMAVRRGKNVDIVLACAMIGRYIANVKDYADKKKAIIDDVRQFLTSRYGDRFHFALTLNALDDASRGQNGLYLTVTGLSCEGGDSGQVGRGNRANGVIPFMRPQTSEAWAGKNSRTHVGRIYSFAAEKLARILTEEIPEVPEATVLLLGEIGSPVEQPPYVFADLKEWGHCHAAVREKAQTVLKNAIETKDFFRTELPPVTNLDQRRKSHA